MWLTGASGGSRKAQGHALSRSQVAAGEGRWEAQEEVRLGTQLLPVTQTGAETTTGTGSFLLPGNPAISAHSISKKDILILNVTGQPSGLCSAQRFRRTVK